MSGLMKKYRKTASWMGIVGILATVALGIRSAEEIVEWSGEKMEAAFTKETNKRIESLEEQLLALAKLQDTKNTELKTELRGLERRLGDKMDENNREQIRLIVQALRSE